MTNSPCETCLRWPECNGVDVANCPVYMDYAASILAEFVQEVCNRYDELAAIIEDITKAIDDIEIPEREPLQPPRNTLKKTYRAPVPRIRKIARSKLK